MKTAATFARWATSRRRSCVIFALPTRAPARAGADLELTGTGRTAVTMRLLTRNLRPATGNTEPVVVVRAVGRVVVTVRRAAVARVVAPRAAPQHAGLSVSIGPMRRA